MLAARADRPPRKPLGVLARAALGIAFICAAGPPALAAVSQSRLDDALTAYDRGDCASAADDARSARAALPARSEPRLVLGWCAARAGRWAQAVSDVNGAVSRDPHDWETHHSRAVVIAASGRGDPRPGAAAALRLDPLEPAAQELAAAFSPPAGPGTWKRRAAAARLFADGLDYPPLGG